MSHCKRVISNGQLIIKTRGCQPAVVEGKLCGRIRLIQLLRVGGNMQFKFMNWLPNFCENSSKRGRFLRASRDSVGLDFNIVGLQFEPHVAHSTDANRRGN